MKAFFRVLVFVTVLAPCSFAADMKTYYANGKPQMEMTDKGMKSYYENGQLQSQTAFKDGKPVGITKMYFPSGKIMREENHSNGKWKQYDVDGHVIAEGKF